MQFVVVMLVLMFSLPSFAQTSCLIHQPADDSMIFFDASQKKTIAQIRHIDFTQSYRPQSHGLTTDAVWIKTQFQPQLACLDTSWFLQFNNPFLDYIDVYLFQNNQQVAHYALGDRRAWPDALAAQRLPTLPLDAHIKLDGSGQAYSLDIYFRIATQNTMHNQFLFISSEGIYQQEKPMIVMSAFIGAALLLLIFLSVMLLILTRKIGFLYYISMLLCYAFVLATVYGWLHFFQLASDPGILIVQPLLTLTFLLVSNALLSLDKQFKKTYYSLLALTLMVVAFDLYSSVIDQLQPALKLTHATGVMTLIVLMIMNIRLLRTNLISRFYFLIFGLMFVALILRVMSINNLIPANIIIDNLFSFMVLLQFIVLFFIMLGYYYNQYLQLIKQQQDLNFQTDLIEQRKLFLRLLSHEFMTPLAINDAILRNLTDDINDLVKSCTSAPHRKQILQDLETQRKTNRRLHALVNQCLTPNFETDRFEEGQVSLAQFIRLLYQNIDQLDDRVRLTVELACSSEQQETYAIKGDGEPLVLATSLVVNNGLKYSNEDQTVAIVLQIEEQQLVIQVRDLGMGFDPNISLASAFQRGRNTQNTSGLGLGLYMSQDILNRYHGHLHIENQTKGSLVSLTIPLEMSVQSAKP